MHSLLKSLYLLGLIIAVVGCGSGSDNTSTSGTTPMPSTPPSESENDLYFPPNSNDSWQTTSLSSLNWNQDALQDLLLLLENNQTRAFIVLKDGRIVIEEYFGSTLDGLNEFDETRNWYWASAGKTLTSFMVGKAQEDGFLSIQDSTSNYLGIGWSSLSILQEEAVKIINQLTMTSGLDDSVIDNDCTLPACLVYLTEPNSRWAYHNAPYTLLTEVVENASGLEFSSYYNEQLRDKIGMDGFWFSQPGSFNLTYFSTARSMARFGLLILNEGKWADEVIMEDMIFFEQMINSSQQINPSYGYLWWLNGKDSFMVPATGQLRFSGSITPDAPSDMIAAIGRDGQFINVIPSQNIVIIRMGLSDENSRVAISVQNQIWEKLKLVIQ